MTIRALTIGILALCAALSGAVFAPDPIHAQAGDDDYVDVAVILEVPDVVAGSLKHPLITTVVNMGTRTAYDVEVVVKVESPAKSHFRPEHQVSDIGSTAVEDQFRTLRWSIPELAGLGRESRIVSVSHHTAPSETTPHGDFDHTDYVHRFSGEVTTSSHESALRKENNSTKVWSYTYDLGSHDPWVQAGGNYTVGVTVDKPSPKLGQTVNFTITAGRETPYYRGSPYEDVIDLVLVSPRTPPPIDQKVAIELTDGLTVSGTPILAPTLTPALQYSNGVFTIGTRKPRELNSHPHSDRSKRWMYSVTLPVTVAGDAKVDEQCLTATVSGNPPPGINQPLDDDIRDNVVELCLGKPELIASSQVDAIKIYPCVGNSDSPCDGTDDVRVRAVNKAVVPERVMVPESAIFHVLDVPNRKYDGGANSVNAGTEVSWQTLLKWDGEKFDEDDVHTEWSNLRDGFTASGINSETPPGKVHIRAFEDPNFTLIYKMTPETSWIGKDTFGYDPEKGTNGPFDYTAEFEKLGTYKLEYKVEHKRATLDGDENCVPNTSEPPVNQRFCATETYIFHVGPTADIEVLSAQMTPKGLEITAANNGPDNSLGARAVLTSDQSCEFLDASRQRDWSPNTHAGNRTCVIENAKLTDAQLAGTVPIGKVENDVDYTVCIGSDGNDVTPTKTSETACTGVTGASWHSGKVLDYVESNSEISLNDAPVSPLSVNPPRTNTVTSLVTSWPRMDELFGSPVSYYQVFLKDGSDWELLGDVPQAQTPQHDDADRGPSDSPSYHARAVNEDRHVGPWPRDAGVTVLAANPLMVLEGGTATYKVSLYTKPTAAVTVTVTSGDTHVTVQPQSLTFTADNWDTAQEVTVSAAEGAAAAAAAMTNDTIPITHAASGTIKYSSSLDVASVNVGVPDIRLQPSSLAVLEGSTATYEVSLNVEPTDEVVIEVTSDNTDVTVTQGTTPLTLTFTTENWETGQEVTVTAAEDSDQDDDTATITHAVKDDDSATEYAGVSAEVAATVRDNDASAGFTVSETALTITEGDTATYTVALNKQPSADVTVTATLEGDSDIGVSPSSRTFSATDWYQPQEFTVSAGEDTDQDDGTATITLTAGGATEYADQDNPITATITVTESDNDIAVPGVTIVPESLTVNEGGTATYDVSLTTQPAAAVDITIKVTSTDVTDVSVDLTTLKFTSTDWQAAQTVTVSASEDDDNTNDSATIEHEVSGSGDYADVTAAPVIVTVTDNEPTQKQAITTGRVTVSPSSLAVTEGGDSVTYEVSLDTQPTANVTIKMSSADPDLTVEPVRHTFTPTNWQPLTVTVSAAEDDDAADDTATITHSIAAAAGSGYTNGTVSLGVSITDNDTAGITVQPQELSVPEGLTDSYTITLGVQPAGEVTILMRSDNPDVTVEPERHMFTPTNWQPLTVTVSAAEDDDAANDTADITHSIATLVGSGYAGITTVPRVAVTVEDSGIPGVTVSESSLTMSEGGTATYDVSLDAKPTAAVTVTVSSDNTDVTVDQGSATRTLTFTVDNWHAAQTVTVSAGEDDDTAADTATISHTVSTASDSNYEGITAASSVSVSVADNDSPGVTVSESDLRVAEGGSATYDVSLDAKPTDDVTIAIEVTSGDDTDTDVTVDVTSLTFIADNWQAAQTVTVSAGEDDDTAADTATISHTVSTASDSNYEGITAASSVSVSVADNDSPGVTVSESDLRVAEGGSATYDVSLDAKPTDDVTIAIEVTSGDDTDTDVTVDVTSLTFIADNWQAAQTVTVSAGEDDDTAADTATISHTVSTASDSNYEGITAASSVSVSVADNDSPGVTVSESDLRVAEGGSATYDVSLDAKPTDDVTIAIEVTSGDDTDTDVTVDVTSLTFIADNWQAAQTVTVSAGEDDDTAADTATIGHTVSGAGEYAGITVAEVAVSVTDNDTDDDTEDETGGGQPDTPAVQEETPTPTPSPLSTTVDTDGSVTLSATGTASEIVSLPMGTVTVSVDEDSAGTQITLLDDDALDDLALVAIYASTNDDALDDLPSSGFRIDGSGTTVNIVLRDEDGNLITELTNAATVCLPVSAELLAETDETQLVLLHYDEEDGWYALAGSTVRTQSDGSKLVCAETTRFSPFAVGYRVQPAATATPIPTSTPVPTSTPAPTPTPTPTATPTQTPTPTSTPTATPTQAPAPTPTPTPTATPTQTPIPTPSPTPEPESAASLDAKANGGFGMWAWMLAAAIVVFPGAAAITIARRRSH